MKIFVDSDVILDIILERTDFNFSKEFINIAVAKKLKLITSPIIFTNSFYIIRKLKNKETALSALKKMRKLFSISVIDEEITDMALESAFGDFEDAIQYYSAIASKANYLVTRNKVDYIGNGVLVTSPQEMMGILESN